MWPVAFWISLGLVLYVYLGYPILVALLAAIRDRHVRRAPCEPRVSILISAYNEEASIRQTLENKLRLDYPRDRLEVIVVSDASSDRTDAIVREFVPQGVCLLRQEPRRGKTAALNLAVEKANGEILVFSDANSLYDRDALRNLVANFADPTVGYVTGRTVYTPAGDRTGVTDGCTTYMGYETLLRLAETRVGSLVGVNGGIDAVRRDLYRPMRADQQPDFVLPMAVVARGYRVVYEPAAVLRETALAAARDEYRMRVRVALRALRAIWDMRQLLNPSRYGVYSWQLFSHKLLRYLAFGPLALAYLSSLLLAPQGPLFQGACLVQTALYFGAVLGWIVERRGWSSRVLLLPYYFCLLNLASAHALGAALLGRQQVVWTPRTG